MIYGLIFIAFIGFMLNYISQRFVFTNFFYNRSISKTIVEISEEFDMTEVIENKKILPVTFLQVISKYPAVMQIRLKNNIYYKANIKCDNIFYTSILSIMPRQRIKRTYRISCIKRGRYLFDEVNINAGDILGLKVFNKALSLPVEVVALPEKYDINAGLVPHGDYFGDISVKRWIIDDPVLTVGIREYTGLEPQKTIHWPSSLRSGRLMVKNFDYTTDNRVLILLNIECAKPFWFSIEYDKIERCISIVRTVAEDFNAEGIPFGFGTNAQAAGFSSSITHINSGWGEAHLSNILEFLGRIEYSIDAAFEDYLERLMQERDSYTTCIIITPKINELYIDQINKAERKFSKMVVISLEENNLDKLNENIITFVERMC